MYPYNIDLDITVSGGTGSASFGAADLIHRFPLLGDFGMLNIAIIIPPSQSNTYEWVLTNMQGNGIAGSYGTLTGSNTIVETTPIIKGATFTILNASADGDYAVQLLITPAPPPY